MRYLVTICMGLLLLACAGPNSVKPPRGTVHIIKRTVTKGTPTPQELRAKLLRLATQFCEIHGDVTKVLALHISTPGDNHQHKGFVKYRCMAPADNTAAKHQ